MAKTNLERKAEQSIKERTLVMVRRLPAAPKQVFQAWTDQSELVKWMGPKDMTIPEASTEPREGGAYRIVMRGADRKDLTVSGQYCEMRPARRLVMTWAWEEEGGHGPVTCITMELRAAGKATEMRFHHALFADKQGRDNHHAGWRSIFDKLAVYLRTQRLN
jgi:glutathione S-transferase